MYLFATHDQNYTSKINLIGMIIIGLYPLLVLFGSVNKSEKAVEFSLVTQPPPPSFQLLRTGENLPASLARAGLQLTDKPTPVSNFQKEGYTYG